MTTVTIDDALATRLRALRDGDGDLNRLIAEALAGTVRLWEWEAAGRAEMQAMLAGPRRPFDPQTFLQNAREKYGWTEDLSALSDEELSDRYEAGLDALTPEKRTEAKRIGLL